MNTAWQKFLEGRGAHFGENSQSNEPQHFGDLDFGDLQSELKHAQNDTILAPLSHLGVIRCTGEDSAAFLHNLMTNDIKGITPQSAILCGFCTAKGRLLADFVVWRDGPESADYLLQLSADIQPALQKKLSMYVLRSKAKLSDASDEIVLLGLSGPAAEIAIKTLTGDVPTTPYSVTQFEHGQVIRLDAQGRRFQLAVQASAAEAIWMRLSEHAQPVGTAAWRWLDIINGKPLITAATQEAFVPQMVNLDLIGGVSFTKGCYPGQEIVARTKYLGKVKRRTLLAHVAGGQPTAGNDVYSSALPDQSSGKVVNAAAAPDGGFDVLIELITANAQGSEVRLGAVDGPVVAFRALPYSLE